MVYCSSGFTRLTGWSKHQLLRRSATCPMMHGPLTDDDALARLRQALTSDSATGPFEIVLYDTNGQWFRSIDTLSHSTHNSVISVFVTFNLMLFLPPPRRLCCHRRLFVCLLAKLLNRYSQNSAEIWLKGHERKLPGSGMCK